MYVSQSPNYYMHCIHTHLVIIIVPAAAPNDDVNDRLTLGIVTSCCSMEAGKDDKRLSPAVYEIDK